MPVRATLGCHLQGGKRRGAPNTKKRVPNVVLESSAGGVGWTVPSQEQDASLRAVGEHLVAALALNHNSLHADTPT